jgi:hypothetical protein
MSYNRNADEALGKSLRVYGDSPKEKAKDAFSQHYRLKQPCSNCPFRKEGAIELMPGRLAGIAQGLIKDDSSTFQCHKTVHSRKGGEFDDNGNYTPSGNEAMCAGAAAYLMKQGRPTIGMRLVFMTKTVPVSFWDEAKDLVVDLVEG